MVALGPLPLGGHGALAEPLPLAAHPSGLEQARRFFQVSHASSILVTHNHGYSILTGQPLLLLHPFILGPI